ncbi:unnamed protein product [Arabis nemorensis]|uniref:RNase H type-1 domain-containing protein n=1 Tax=Arabis nemorensis TaxID=586526 RepID=A0A565BGM2_9BRAS|nr:unnamed protein product [Arabis nemorensis]
MDGTISGIGWFLRDHKGMVQWIGAKTYPRMKIVPATETEALRWALIMINSLGEGNGVVDRIAKEALTYESCIPKLVSNWVKTLVDLEQFV